MALAVDLFNRVSLKGNDKESINRICEYLPGLLKTFAMKVGFKGPSQIHRDVMCFVHKYRKYVALSVAKLTNLSRLF
jgi:hypothetical protein